MQNDLYLNLIKKTLTDYHRIEDVDYLNDFHSSNSIIAKLISKINSLLERKNLAITKKRFYNIRDREIGKDWPLRAETMIGIKRLENIELCINQIIKNNIPGDLIETGVWRGGATIFMKAVLAANNDFTRVVWVADSFKGLPKPNHSKYVEDSEDIHYKISELKISKEHVIENFKKYDLLDDNVKFLEGWFKDTLPNAPINKLSLLRLDGDMYESTMDAIKMLYPKLSIGGYVIVDDFGAVKGCKKAIEDYRSQFGITEELIEIDWTGVYWKKLSEIDL